jgi:DNA mismatch endonuclease (patch repair protein)
LADIFTTEKRSKIMSRIRSSGTTPERKLFEIVRQTLGQGRRIDRNIRTLPGQPDIVVPSLHLVLFADGCFYHGCPKHGHYPKSNRKYWVPKLARNRERDKAARKELRRLGFEIWKIWECALKGKKLAHTVRILDQRLSKKMAACRS